MLKGSAKMSHIEPHLYTDEQYQRIGMLDAWHTLLDAHNALLYGFIQNRLPEPGKAIDITEAENHISRIEKEWEAEKQIRDSGHQWTGAPAFSTMPLNAKLYLHSVLLDVLPDESSIEPADNPKGAQLQPPERSSFLRRILQKLMNNEYHRRRINDTNY